MEQYKNKLTVKQFNPFPNKPLFFTCLQCKSFENTVEKGELAQYEQFLLFTQCFPSVFYLFSLRHFSKFKIAFWKLSVWKSLKLSFGKRVEIRILMIPNASEMVYT